MKLTSHIPIILLSSKTLIEDEIVGFRLGAILDTYEINEGINFLRIIYYG
jgi:hypothetical protein